MNQDNNDKIIYNNNNNKNNNNTKSLDNILNSSSQKFSGLSSSSSNPSSSTDFVAVHLGGGYDSSLSSKSTYSDGSISKHHQPHNQSQINTKRKLPHVPKRPPETLGTTAYERHRKFVQDFVRYYGNDALKEHMAEQRPDRYTNAASKTTKTDYDMLRENYRFIRTEEDDHDTSFESRLAKRYYDKLNREYVLADLSRYKTGAVGMRWRTQKEVVDGKGQFVCGGIGCSRRDEAFAPREPGVAVRKYVPVRTYGVNFVYKEKGQKKRAPVKLRLCDRCSAKMSYRKNKDQLKASLKEHKKIKQQLLKQEKEKNQQTTEKESSSSRETQPMGIPANQSPETITQNQKRNEKSPKESKYRRETINEEQNDQYQNIETQNHDNVFKGLFP